jgi:hypothetical protein
MMAHVKRKAVFLLNLELHPSPLETEKSNPQQKRDKKKVKTDFYASKRKGKISESRK